MLNFTLRPKAVQNVLLSNSNTYLGCNILYQILTKTSFNICLPVNHELFSGDVFTYINNQANKYLKINLNSFSHRLKFITIFAKDENLGLDESSFLEIAKSVDTVIHLGNVGLTQYTEHEVVDYLQEIENYLKLAKLTNYAELHFISPREASEYDYLAYLQLDNNDPLIKNLVRAYNKSFCIKQQAEALVTKARENGIVTNIYRLDNLCINSSNFVLSDEIGTQPYFNLLSIMLNLEIVPKELIDIEFSPIDMTSEALVAIVSQTELKNQLLQLQHPIKSSLYDLIAQYQNMNIIMIELAEFISILRKCLQRSPIFIDRLSGIYFRLCYHLLNPKEETPNSHLTTLTNSLLHKLNYHWKGKDSAMLKPIVEKAKQYLDQEIETVKIFTQINLMAQMIPAICFWLDCEGKFVGINHKAAKAFGVDQLTNFLYKSPHDLYPSEIAEALFNDIQKALSIGQDIKGEYKLIDISLKKDKDLSITLSPLKTSTGEIIGLLGTAIDITNERAAGKFPEKFLPDIFKENFLEPKDEFKRAIDEIVYSVQISTIQLIKDKVKANINKGSRQEEVHDTNLEELNSYIYGRYHRRQKNFSKVNQ